MGVLALCGWLHVLYRHLNTTLIKYICLCACVLLQAKQSLATLTKDVPKRHSLAMPTEAVVNGNQEWVMHAEMPLTAAIRQSQHSLYHTLDRHGTHTLQLIKLMSYTRCNCHTGIYIVMRK